MASTAFCGLQSLGGTFVGSFRFLGVLFVISVVLLGRGNFHKSLIDFPPAVCERASVTMHFTVFEGFGFLFWGNMLAGNTEASVVEELQHVFR